MKKIIYTLIAISLIFVSCDKDNQSDNPEDDIIVGGVYLDYTAVIINPCDVKVNVMDDTINFNKLEAIYSSHKPTSNQNVLLIYLSDTINNKGIDFQIFTPFMQPENFFIESTYNIDTVKIHWAGVVEDFFDANAIFKWDTVSFENLKFSGKASFEIPAKITGKINSNTYYPKQTIEFEF